MRRLNSADIFCAAAPLQPPSVEGLSLEGFAAIFCAAAPLQPPSVKGYLFKGGTEGKERG